VRPRWKRKKVLREKFALSKRGLHSLPREEREIPTNFQGIKFPVRVLTGKKDVKGRGRAKSEDIGRILNIARSHRGSIL